MCSTMVTFIIMVPNNEPRFLRTLLATCVSPPLCFLNQLRTTCILFKFQASTDQVRYEIQTTGDLPILVPFNSPAIDTNWRPWELMGLEHFLSTIQWNVLKFDWSLKNMRLLYVISSLEPATGPHHKPLNPLHTSLRLRFILILSSNLRLGIPGGDPLPSWFQAKILYTFLITLMQATGPTYLIILVWYMDYFNLIYVSLYGDTYNTYMI
jgi:hypothetical protein